MIQLFRDLHQKVFQNKRVLLLFIIETLVFFYVIWWLNRQIQLDVSVIVLGLSFLAFSYLGFVLSYSELRYYVILLFFALFSILVDSLGYLLTLFLKVISEEQFGFSHFYFRQYLYILGAMGIWGFTFNWFLFRWKKFFYIEVFFFIAFLVTLLKSHRNYKISELDLFTFELPFTGSSELILFFTVLFLFLIFIVLFFYSEEESSSQSVNHSLKERFKGLKTTLGFITLFLIIGFVTYLLFKEEEPKITGIPNQLMIDSYLDLFPEISADGGNTQQAIVKMEVPVSSYFVGQTVQGTSQYISRRIISGFDPQKNLFFVEKNLFESNIPQDSEDHYFRFTDDQKSKELNFNLTNLLLSFNYLISGEIPFLVDDLAGRFSDKESAFTFDRTPLNQEYYIIQQDPNNHLYINRAELIEEIVNKDPSQFKTAYRVESKAYFKDMQNLETIKNYEDLNKEFLEYYTKAPSNKAYNDLAEKIVRGSKSQVEKVLSLADYLRSNYKYSTNPGGKERRDQLSYFLFDNKKGYCTYFASALAALCRSIEIPSRVVVGYLTSGDDHVENYYLIRSKYAHAWVEVYFKEYGWITFDGTAAPTNFDGQPSDKQDLLSLIEALEKDTEPMPRDSNKLSQSTPVNKRNNSLYLYLLSLVFPLGLTFIVMSKQFFRYRCIREKRPKRQVFYHYSYMIKTLQDYSIRRKESETAQQFADRVLDSENIDIHLITQLYTAVKYSATLPEHYRNDLKRGFAQWNQSLNSRFAMWKKYLFSLNLAFFIDNK